MEEINKLCDEELVDLFIAYNSIKYIKGLFAKANKKFPNNFNDIYNVEIINEEFIKRFSNESVITQSCEVSINLLIHLFVELSENGDYEDALFSVFNIIEVQ